MIRTESYSPNRPELLIDIELPTTDTAPPDGWPTIVWLHGGGWRLQDRLARPDFTRNFASRGFAMASIDYRLAPEHTHPAQVVDLRQALRWLRANSERLTVDPNRIALWGSSAGGHIATVTALSSQTASLPGESVPASFEEHPTDVTCVVEGYGPALIGELLRDWKQADPTRHTPEEDLLGGPATSATEHRALLDRAAAASPALLDAAEAPPFLILHGTADTLVPSSQSQELHDHLLAADRESLLCLVEGFGHGFLNPGEVQELGPGIRLDNGRLEAEPDTPCTIVGAGSFDPHGRSASFDLIHDFFTHHLYAGR